MTGYLEKLYDFQRRDVEKLYLPGGLDASDMGSGKTIKGVAYDELYNPDSPTLVVCPLGVAQHWRSHFMQANLPVVKLDPKDRDAGFKRFRDNHNKVLIVHWEALQRRLHLLEQLQHVRWGLVIADEIQYMQNRKSQAAAGIRSLRTKRKLALSGTPATTNITGYWSALNWLYPTTSKGGWGSYWAFVKRYVKTEEDFHGYTHIIGPNQENLPEFFGRIDPYYVRHMKREQCCPDHPNGVMPWLPDKSYEEYNVELLPQQRRAYENMKKEFVAWVGAHESEPVIAANFASRMVRLCQFTGAYATVLDDGSVRLSEPSPKLDIAEDIIQRSSRPIVVFSMYRQMIELLKARLNRAGCPMGMYTGGNKTTRDADKEAFESGEIRVLGLTISAGGVGLDGLQRVADTAIFLDRDWSPARNVQAEDRLWRDGQDNAVNIIDIISTNTVEQGRRQDIVEKWDWLRQMLGDKRGVRR